MVAFVTYIHSLKLNWIYIPNVSSGKGRLKSLEGAFRICNKSIGERKFGNHSVKKDGTQLTELAALARQVHMCMCAYMQICIHA